jgi:hypothetical protein
MKSPIILQTQSFFHEVLAVTRPESDHFPQAIQDARLFLRTITESRPFSFSDVSRPASLVSHVTLFLASDTAAYVGPDISHLISRLLFSTFLTTPSKGVLCQCISSGLE